MTAQGIGIMELRMAGALDISEVEYSPPYLICAVQEQGLVIIHENFFTAP